MLKQRPGGKRELRCKANRLTILGFVMHLNTCSIDNVVSGFGVCRVILSGCQWFVFSKGGSEDERCFRYSGQGYEPVEGTKTKTNNILTGTEPETKSNFKVPNRIKKLKWPLTGKKVHLSFHLIF